MTLLTTSAANAFAFPIGELPADLRFEPALGGRSLASGFHPRTDLEVAPLAGDGDETGTNVEHGEAPPLIVVGVGHERPLVTTGARACLLEALPGERLDLLRRRARCGRAASPGARSPTPPVGGPPRPPRHLARSRGQPEPGGRPRRVAPAAPRAHAPRRGRSRAEAPEPPSEHRPGCAPSPPGREWSRARASSPDPEAVRAPGSRSTGRCAPHARSRALGASPRDRAAILPRRAAPPSRVSGGSAAPGHRSPPGRGRVPLRAHWASCPPPARGPSSPARAARTRAALRGR